MKIYVEGVKDVELETPVGDNELAMMVSLARKGLIRCSILVTQGEKMGRLPLADIDIGRTFPEFVWDRITEAPPPA